MRSICIACVVAFAACAQGVTSDPDGSLSFVDAPPLADGPVTPDAPFGTPDGPPPPDAPLGTPDAAVPDARPPDAALPDATPPPPDATPPPPDAALPDATPPPPDATPPPPDAALPDATPPPPDATPPPDASGCTNQWINLLANPSFDSGPSADWFEVAPLGEFIQTSPPLLVATHTPTYAAWMGGPPDNNEVLRQEVTVPAGATALRFRGQRWTTTAEELIFAPVDFLRMQIRSTADTLLETLATYDEYSSVTAWTAFSHTAASAYAGQTIRLYLNATTDFSLATNFYLDTFALEAFVCQ